MKNILKVEITLSNLTFLVLIGKSCLFFPALRKISPIGGIKRGEKGQNI